MLRVTLLDRTRARRTLALAGAALLPASALAQDDPGPIEPAYGMDVALGVQPGAILGAWPDAGVHGTAGARVDVFPVPATTAGPRVGASVWARSSVWPHQTHTPAGGEPETFRFLHYGLSAAIRHDPTVPWTGTFSFGFSRLDLEGWEGGFHTVPVFVVDAGVRRRLGDAAFLDWTASGGWGSARGVDGAAEEWWTVGLGVALGIHAR